MSRNGPEFFVEPRESEATMWTFRGSVRQWRATRGAFHRRERESDRASTLSNLPATVYSDSFTVASYEH